MSYMDAFKMPKAVTIMARTSSITNSFVNGIVPSIMPSEAEIKRTLDILGMEADHVRCAYCGDACTEWDHFRPLVIDKKPTGYITEINNLVPACGKCNQSKGNRYWREWMLSDAVCSPKTRGVQNLELLISRLEQLEADACPVWLDFEAIVGEELWRAHWENCSRLHVLMKESQGVSDRIRALVAQAYRSGANPWGTEAQEQTAPQPAAQQVARECPERDADPQSRPVGFLVKQHLRKILVSGNLPDSLVEALQDLSYCKKTFALNFPVLLKVNSRETIFQQRKDHLGRDRFYADPVIISGETYLLTSQWYDRNKEKLLAFLAKVQ